MWAMTNRHKNIAKLLLDNGASSDQKTSSGRTAFDFVPPDSDMSFYLHDNGYNIGNAGMSDDFYNPGFSQDRFEEEMAENELRRRLMMESARDLEVDLGNVGIDDQPEVGTQLEYYHSSPLTLAARGRIRRGAAGIRLGKVSARSNVCLSRTRARPNTRHYYYQDDPAKIAIAKTGTGKYDFSQRAIRTLPRQPRAFGATLGLSHGSY